MQRSEALTEVAVLEGDFPWAFQTVVAAPGVCCLFVLFVAHACVGLQQSGVACMLVFPLLEGGTACMPVTLQHVAPPLVSAGVRTLKEKNQIWDVHCKLLRAQEQVEKAKRDITAFAQYYQGRVEQLVAVEAGEQTSLHGGVLGDFVGDAAVQAGLSAMLARGRAYMDRQCQRADALLLEIA